MTPPEQVDNVVSRVQQQLGIDVYGLFEGADTRRLIVESVLTAIATALVIEYLKGLLQPKEVGEGRSRALGSFIGGLKRDQQPDQVALKRRLAADIKRLGSPKAGEHAAAAISFATDLVEAGVSAETAKTIAETVSRVVGQSR